jgi:DNA modification methylase
MTTRKAVAPSLKAGEFDRHHLAITYRSPTALRPDPGNARTHSKRQIEQLARSMAEFGFTNPILVAEGGSVIAGHGRLLAAKSLGFATVPVIELCGLSNAQKVALQLADNKIAQNAGWDPDLLRVQIESISNLDISFDLSLTGFGAAEIDVALSQGRSQDPDDEIVGAVPMHPVTRLGDIWQLGPHRVACGDCRDRSVVAELMAAEMADACFTDPPYNVAIDGFAVGKGRHREFAMASGELSSAQFLEFLTQTLGNCAAVSRAGAVHFVCMDHRHIAELTAAGDTVYGDRLNICVWVKSNAGMGSLYRSQHELVFVFRVGEEGHFNAVELGRHGRNRTNVWTYPSVNTFRGSRRRDLTLHPTVKPVALVVDAIRDVTRRDDVVLDAFLGSGTTLLACERVGRRCRGVEIDPGYVDVAVTRWSDATGSEPVHLATGKPFSMLRAMRASREKAHAKATD